MSGERCPCCGGREPHPAIDAGIDVRVCPYCDFSWEEGTGAYFEPRDRLPTKAEERAHAETWGKGSGWMIRLADRDRLCRRPWHEAGSWAGGAVLDGYRGRDEAWQSYPIAPDGRPVGWPTVKEG